MTQVRVVGVAGLGPLGESLLRLAVAHGAEAIGVDTDPPTAAAVGARVGGAVVGTDLAALRGADVVIEALPERAELKRAVLRRLAVVCGPGTVLATCADPSSAPSLAAACGRPGALAGLHFATPPPRGSAELFRAGDTSSRTLTTWGTLLSSWGCTTLTPDPAVRLARTLVLRYLDRAADLVGQGYAAGPEVDTAMRLGCGLPFGPFELLDFLGPQPQPRTGGGGGQDGAPGPRPAADPMAVRGVAVVGSGVMARGIAESVVRAGLAVTLVARGEAKAAAAVRAVGDSLARAVARGRLTEQAAASATALLRGSGELAAVSAHDVVIEAVREDLAVKEAVFAQLDAVCRPGALLATTTSSLPVAACAAATGRPADVVGLHFFNPAPVMRLVEVVRTPVTGERALDTAAALCARLGKTAVVCRDRAGFIVNYLLFPFLNDAVRLAGAAGVGAAELDAAVEALWGHPMGPFALLDTIGLDVSLAISRRLHREYGQADFAPAPALAELVALGRLGRKSGEGFRRTAPPRAGAVLAGVTGSAAGTPGPPVPLPPPR